MHLGMAPGTAISAAQSSGTAPNPISRMAVAGKMLVTSAVAVNRTLTMSSSANSLRAMISRISSCERVVTWATVSSSTVVAPQPPDRESGCHGGSLYRQRFGRPCLVSLPDHEFGHLSPT